MKRLAIFLDGTWNDHASETNVLNLSRLVTQRGADGAEQRWHYNEGVGTKKFEKIRGGTVGMGLSQYVRKAYGWLLENYEDEDEVYIIGFSRGAYTARSLGGLIAGCGLVKPGAPDSLSIEKLYDRYQRRKDTAEPIYRLQFIRETHQRKLTEEESTLLDHSRRIRIKMIGVWDTVGALGVPWTGMPFLGRDKFYFHNPNLSKIYDNAFQALAIDEHRGAYKPTLWTLFSPDRSDGATPSPPEMPPLANVEQRWFVGAHANVGGGYPRNPLGELPLAWLAGKVQSLGLGLKSPFMPSPTAHLAKPVDSYAEFLFHAYQVLTLGRRYYRPIGVRANKVKRGWSFPVNEYIDASVFRRWNTVPDYRPRNLGDWAECAGHRIEMLSGDVPARTD